MSVERVAVDADIAAGRLEADAVARGVGLYAAAVGLGCEACGDGFLVPKSGVEPDRVVIDFPVHSGAVEYQAKRQ